MDLRSDPTQVDPVQQPVDQMTRPEPLDLEFEGWSPEAFELLDRLRAHPHIDQYQQEKPGVYDYVKDPFKRYRNDLVVNWVLPNRLDFETEKNVFARLLKNDFGAGGCKDNLWMSFYRPGRKRLKDVQISHNLSPDGFDVGLFVGGYANDLLGDAQARIERAPDRYLALLNPLLKEKSWRFYFRTGSGKSKQRHTYEAPLDAVPDAVPRANDLFVRRHFPRDQVLAWGPQLLEHTLDAVLSVWPIYRFYLSGTR
ncbi:MAG: hypothetical protein GVY35_18850 [Bacteroidetes bacterium]|jgi:hypothetical protein|nr:hypothetical protein [Bacteroidota bacterium]